MKRKAKNFSKFNNKPTIVDGHRFASKKEAQRYNDLKYLQQAGQIAQLKLQPRFDLIVNELKVGTYVGDFQYVVTSTGEEIVEDVKSPATTTPLYKLKKKILEAQQVPIFIKEYF
jgi:formylmethanofuran dehydrogenase subunit E-like metal-binding protein|tara:strand:+ start:6686 stop:7030 length:345 start_codon:yes stop_codon:yes gene_type:complete